jgi:5'-nucleotidase
MVIVAAVPLTRRSKSADAKASRAFFLDDILRRLNLFRGLTATLLATSIIDDHQDNYHKLRIRVRPTGTSRTNGECHAPLQWHATLERVLRYCYDHLMSLPHILLTNDDGVLATGLRTLAAAFQGFAKISIVAPSREQSGAAQSLTLRQPIICHALGEREWAVDGTPADCVIVALHKLLPERPDMVVSGINFGANLGENVYYSGTVGAAREAALHHIPAVAISLCSKAANVKFEPAARVARAAAELILKERLLNINVPEPWSGGVKLTRQSKKITRNQLSEGKDPRGRMYFWLFEQRIDKDVAPDSDHAAIFDGAVSITPLHLDPTHTDSLNHLSRWAEPIAKAFQNR